MTLLTTIIAAILLASAAAAQDLVAEEYRDLQGTWEVIAGEQGGKPFDAIKGGMLTISGRSFLLTTAAGNKFSGELRVESSVAPRQLDFVHPNGVVWEAIYTVSGDSFRLNYVEAGGREKRPTVFATSAETSALIVVLRRRATQARMEYGLIPSPRIGAGFAPSQFASTAA